MRAASRVDFGPKPETSTCGGRSGRPLVLRGRGLPERASVAAGAGGDMLAAWQRRLGGGRTLVEARFRPAGRGWGPVASLGTSTVAARLVTAVAQNGRAYVAWASQNISESTGVSSSTRVAVRPAGARAFRPAQALEQVRASGSFVPFAGPTLALAGTGAYVAWTGRDGNWRVRFAATDARARFGSPQTLSPAGVDSALGDLSALRDGTAAVTWSSLDSELLVRDVMASVRRPSGPFGPPELVSDDALRRPSIALDAVTRQPTVVWPQRLGPTARVAEITAYTRASSRTGD